jgi:hypothetical protein
MRLQYVYELELHNTNVQLTFLIAFIFIFGV